MGGGGFRWWLTVGVTDSDVEGDTGISVVTAVGEDVAGGVGVAAGGVGVTAGGVGVAKVLEKDSV